MGRQMEWKVSGLVDRWMHRGMKKQLSESPGSLMILDEIPMSQVQSPLETVMCYSEWASQKGRHKL